MEVAGIVANQVLVMFLLIGVGALLSRIGWFSENTARQVTKLLVYIVSPALIVVAYQRDYAPDDARTLLWCVGLAVVTHLVGIVIGKPVFRPNEKHYPNNRDKIAYFGSMYSNAGFFAYPLLIAVFGTEGVFYGVAYTAVFLLFNWTHGVILLNGRVDWKQFGKLLLNPAIIGVVIGLVLYFTGWRLPSQANEVLSYLGDLNTPLAMIVIGGWFTRADWKAAARDWTLYLASAVRLLVIPLLMLGLYLLLPIDETVKIAALIPAASPAAANTAMMPALFGHDQYYGTQLVAFSTILSIVTLPCMVWLAQSL